MHLTGNPPLIVILGPTAVGKTDVALELAEKLQGEIVGADSRQIYQYMNIGTAKPTLNQQQRIPHHLIDVVTPNVNLALSQFQQLAYRAIADISARGLIPFLVGGTGQYLTAVTQGWTIPQVPPNPELRKHLEDYAKEQGAQALHNRLVTLDPISATRIDYRNVRRVVRALEVCIETGTPISELQKHHPPPYQIMTIGITLDRDILYQRADQRVDSMMKQGFLEEVQDLLSKGYSPALPAMSGIGYRQLALHLTGTLPYVEAIEQTKFETHDFIRRQYTWFKQHDVDILWHNRDTLNIESLLKDVARWCQR
jgi:tRNA dimethylallyltransferase